MPIPISIVHSATADAGSPLEKDLRTRLEDSFGVSLRHVRIHRTPESFIANRALGSLAFTLNHHICLARELDPCGGPLSAYVMAHEVAHVVQKELDHSGQHRCAPVPSRARLEIEADASARRILAGKSVLRLTPDPSPEPRCWGPAGHYYTVFLASMMAGLPLEDCKSNAFYAQMPDQVTELDAIPAGTNWGKRLFHGPNNYNTDQMVVDRNVQVGLHSLSGWAADAETKYRKKILDGLEAGSFEFGLALHSYGDSYAHRILNGGDRMYMFPLGHAVELFNGAHRPDRMEFRPNLYRDYGLALFDMFIERWQISIDNDSKLAQRRRFAACLDGISGQSDETSQIAQIGTIKQFEGALELRILNSYYPEMDEEVSWSQFCLRNRLNGQGIDPGLLDRALECAESWSRGITIGD